MTTVLALITEALSSEVFLRGAGGAAFLLYNAKTWRPLHYVAWATVVLLGMEILSALVFAFGYLSRPASIPVRGKHLDELSPLDMAFIGFNKTVTCLFTYQLLQFMAYSDAQTHFLWHASELSVPNTIVALPLLYIVYDLFYTMFHRILHHRSVYRFIHKHHHRQKAPSRGNSDAVNVHPFEFVTGEYNHMLALYLVSRFLVPVHVYTALVFIVLGGFLASLNHTRLDIRAPLGIYDVKYHDVHHWHPESNYGQYIVLWDVIMGSYKPYPSPSKPSTHTASATDTLSTHGGAHTHSSINGGHKLDASKTL